MVVSLLRRYAFGILPRYVFGQILKAFVLALITLTCVFVLFMVVPKAAETGLGPLQIIGLLPLAVPGTIPYTAPLALLFAVSVVYGRIASDNEVIAVKASGLGVMTVLWPSFLLGVVMSLGLLVLTQEVIPRSNRAAKEALLQNMEDMLYRVLKKHREFDNRFWPFRIKVDDVEDNVLLGALFLHRSKPGSGSSPYDLQVHADRATIHFNQSKQEVEVRLIDAWVQGDAKQPDFVLLDNEYLQIPIGGNRPGGGRRLDATVQELTTLQIVRDQAECRLKLDHELRKASVEAALTIASGRFFRRVKWNEVGAAAEDREYWRQRYDKLETEKHMRIALACGSFFFVLIGAPVGVWRARGDFLSAFMTCFLPIILLYYPLTLLGVNLGKEGQLDPFLALWSGNLLLGVLGGIVLHPVRRH